MRKILLKALALGLLCAASAQAGSYTNTFNSDTSTNLLDFNGSLWDGMTASGTGSAAWIPNGGAGPIGGTLKGPVLGVSGDGYLQLTTAAVDCTNSPGVFTSGLCGGILFDDFDSGLVVAGFTFEADLRIGNGLANPADGFSLNYVRAADPILAGIAAGQTFPQMNGGVSSGYVGHFSDNGGAGDLSLMEEGATTGLAIGFDMWDSGMYTIPPASPAVGRVAPGLTWDNIGLDIRVDDVLLTTIAMPNGTINTRNGLVYDDMGNDISSLRTDSAGTNAPTDPTAIETGPFDGTGCAFSLSWVHLKVTLDPDTQVLNVYWKNKQVLTNFATGFFPSPGRLVLAARVGGNTANIGIDNIQLTTYPYVTLSIGNPQATLFGETVQASDSGKSVADTNTIKIVIDGTNNIQPDLVTRTNTTTIIGWTWWNGTAPYAIGSTQTVTVSMSDTNGTNYSFTTPPLVVPSYTTLPGSLGVTNVNTGDTGFNVEGYHVTAGPFVTSAELLGTPGSTLETFENSVRRAEEEMAGLLGPNDNPGVLIVPGTINYSVNTNSPEGDFSSANGYPDVPFPGLPNGATDMNSQDNFAFDFETIIHFPEAGIYIMTFNSDDGFRMTAGNPATDKFNAMTISEFDGGRGAADTSVALYVPTPGYYPMRTIYFQGAGGAGAEWSAQELAPTPGVFALVNDSKEPTALKSYRVSTTAYPAAVTFIDPVPNSGTYQPNWPMMAQITDGSAGTISAAALYLNGAPVMAVVGKSGAVTTLTYTNATPLPAGANSLGISFKDAGGTLHSNAVSFPVEAYTLIPASMALAPTAVDTTKGGFDVYPFMDEAYVDSTSMASGSLPNHVFPYQLQKHGLVGWPNAADFTVNWTFTGPGGTNYVETSQIAYNAQTGNYAGGTPRYGDAFGAGSNMPGIPGITNNAPLYNGTNVTDGNTVPLTSEFSLQIKTALHLEPGLYQMDVSSDDGFSAYVGNPDEWRTQPLLLGEFDNGRSGQETAFNFWITTAGYYPFILDYFGCPGPNEVTWMTVNPYPGNNIYFLINDSTASLPGPNGTSYNPAVMAYQYPYAATKGSPYIASYGPSMFRGEDAVNATAHSTHTGYDAPVWANLVDGDTVITTSSIQLWVNGAQVTPTVSKTGNTTSVNYTPPSHWASNSTNTISLVFLDRTATWSFMVEDHPNATFFIEAEDFDSGGKSVPAASVMPYWGGAYAGMPATLGVDYFRADAAAEPWYRLAHSSSVSTAAPLNPNVPLQFVSDLDRGVNEVQANYGLGSITGATPQWYNYTRTFPAGSYNIYGGLGNADAVGTVANSRYAVLQEVSTTATNNLGIFSGTATGNAYQYGGVGQGCSLLPLSDPNGNMLSVALSGATTLRVWFPASGTSATVAGIPTTLAAGNGNWDFLLFNPAATTVPAPTLTFARASGHIVITFTGTLSSAPTVKGTYKDITGATSPYTVPAGTPTSFFRSHN